MTAIFGILKWQGVSLFCITVENEPRICDGHYQKSCQILKLDKERTSQIGEFFATRYVKAELRWPPCWKVTKVWWTLFECLARPHPLLWQSTFNFYWRSGCTRPCRCHGSPPIKDSTRAGPLMQAGVSPELKNRSCKLNQRWYPSQTGDNPKPCKAKTWKSKLRALLKKVACCKEEQQQETMREGSCLMTLYFWESQIHFLQFLPSGTFLISEQQQPSLYWGWLEFVSASCIAEIRKIKENLQLD